MKIVSLLLAAIMVVSYAYAADEDFLKACGSHCKVLKEDTKVRVVEYTAKKGDKVAMHSHPAHVVYVIKAGKVKWTFPDGTTKETEGGDGEALINSPLTHAQEHLSDVRVIIVEFKQ